LKDGVVDLRGLALVGGVGSWLVGILLGSVLLVPALALLVCGGMLLICIVLFWHDRRVRLMLCFAICLVLGAWRYTVASPSADPRAISRFIGAGVVQVQGVVCEEPKLQGGSRKIILTVDKISSDKGQTWENTSGKLSAQLRGVLLEVPYGPNYSDEVQLQGKLQPASTYDPPGVFASMSFPRVSIKSTAQNPLIAYLYHVRTILADIITQALPQPRAALLVAILLSLL
jgi:competence protein ComEC